MLSFNRKPARVQEAKAVTAPAISAIENQLLAALDDLVRSNLKAQVSVDGRLGETLERLLALVRQTNAMQLNAVSDLAVQAGEAAINMGWVYNDFRDVADSTKSISGAVVEMAASIHELAESSRASTSQAEAARDTMRGCAQDSRGAIDAMLAIQKRSSHIGNRVAELQAAVDQINSMTGAIDSIARQTNLLALNATIEAARAGEAGRGFAVVASEVKELSVETGKATQQIRNCVEALTSEMAEISVAVKESLKSVDEGSQVVTQVSTIIGNVGDEVSEVAERIRGLFNLIQQQEAATSEISQNVVQISEKATKNKDEVEAIAKRLQDAEKLTTDTFRASEAHPVENVGLIRFPADATIWKRQLCSALLGTEPVQSITTKLSNCAALQDVRRLKAVDPSCNTAANEFENAVTSAQKSADLMVQEVKVCNWSSATPAYIACEEALMKAIAAAKKLFEIASR